MTPLALNPRFPLSAHLPGFPALACWISIFCAIATPIANAEKSGDSKPPHAVPKSPKSGDGSFLPPLPAGSRWEPISAISDEFNAKALDTSKWQPIHPYWSGRPPSRFDPANVSVSGGNLRLAATTDVTDLSEVEDPMKDEWVKASCVTSLKRLAISGAYYECRFKASKLSMTSSFWLQGGGGEIDIVEQLGAPLKNPDQAKRMLMNTHLFKNVDGKKTDSATPAHFTMPVGSADTYHTYGVWWRDKNHAWFYYNGERVAEIKFAGPFKDPMFMFLDTEVFTWAGLPDIKSLNDPSKNTMLVDWVRSWKMVPETQAKK